MKRGGSAVQDLPGRQGWARGADTQLGGTDQDGGDREDDAGTDQTEAQAPGYLAQAGGKDVRQRGNNFRLPLLKGRGRDRLGHHNRLLSQ